MNVIPMTGRTTIFDSSRSVMAGRGSFDQLSGRRRRAKEAPRRMRPPGTVMLPRKVAVWRARRETRS